MDSQELQSFNFSYYQDQEIRVYAEENLLDVLSGDSKSHEEPFGSDFIFQMDQKPRFQQATNHTEIDQQLMIHQFGEENPSLSNSYLSTSTESKNHSILTLNLNKGGKMSSQPGQDLKKKDKKDEMRNLYPNAMKSVIRKILLNVEIYDRKLEQISGKMEQDFGFLSLRQFKAYCQGLKVLDFSLRDIYGLMNYNEGNKEERQLKKMLNEFFVWFLEKRYTIEIIRSQQCEFKETYLRGKNLLRYLPTIKPKKAKEGRKDTLSNNF